MTEKFQHKKSLGQHFLNSDFVPKKMCDAAGLTPGRRSNLRPGGEVVLEIGPGTGILTAEILKRGASVVAIEADARAITSLQETFANEIATGQLTIYHHDARALNLAEFGLVDQQFKIIANIPYYISGLLFRLCLESDIQPTNLVFLVQREVAARIARDVKSSILSMSVRVYGDPTYVDTIKRGHFTPPPAVDSAIVAVNDINRSRLQGIVEADFFTALHAAFGQKRKQLAGNLAPLFGKQSVVTALIKLDLPADVRAEDLTTRAFVDLLLLLSAK